MLYFRQILSTSSNRYSYLLADLAQGEAMVIDPAAEQSLLYTSLLKEIRARLRGILLTHCHGATDAAGEGLLAVSGVRLYAGDDAHTPKDAYRFKQDCMLNFGGESVWAWPTPGHTAGAVCYVWRDRLFTGDTLLIGDARPECEDADPAALFDSVSRRLLPLPDETLIYPGRRLGQRMVSCIGEQRGRNPLLGGMTRDEFIAAQLRERV